MNPRELYAIASGYNVALIDLPNIETLKPALDTRYFVAPRAIPFASYGSRRGRLTGLGTKVGFKKVDWQLSIATRLQDAYASTTWCNGGRSGEVTIYSRLGGVDYHRYNCILALDDPIEMNDPAFFWEDYRLHFSHLVLLA